MKKMRRCLLFVLAVVCLFGLIGNAYADLLFKPYVKSYRATISPKWEQDAEVLAEVHWAATAPAAGFKGVTGIDGSYLYNTNVFTYSAGSNPQYLDEATAPFAGANGLVSIINGQYTTAPGSALFSRTIAASGTPLGYSAQDYKVYVPDLLIRSNATLGNTNLNFNNLNAKVLGKDAADQTQTITGSGPYQNLVIEVTAATPPQNFTGLTGISPVNGTTGKQIGNTVTLSWTDLNNAGAPFTNDDTPPIYYDIYYNEGVTFDNPPSEARFSGVGNLSGNTKTLGGSGVVGSPVLKDKTTYFFRLRAKDSTTLPEVLDKHKTTYTDAGAVGIVTSHINDYTAPEDIPGLALAPDDTKLTVSWNGASKNNNDLAGYIVLRADSPDGIGPTPPNLGGASDDNDGPDYSGIALKREIIPGSGWIKIAQQAGTAPIIDSDLDNTKKYKYAVYAYDVVSGDEQGRNYTTVPAAKVGQPGKAPGPVVNFIAISSPEARQITLMWDAPNETFYKGAKIAFTNDKAEWRNLTATSPLAVDQPAVVGVEQSKVLSSVADGTALDMGKIYYFKAFTYNDSGMIDENNFQLAAALPTIAGGTAAGPLFKGKLYGVRTDKLILNTIAVPDSWRGKKASDLARKINEEAMRNGSVGRVNSIYYWDSNEGKSMGVTYTYRSETEIDGTIGAGQTDFELTPGVGYQIYVEKDIADVEIK